MTPVLLVISGGALASVQDAGRRGYECYGVPRSGAMDTFALAAANMLVGNHAGAATIEITAAGAAFEALENVVVAVAGGDLGAQLDGGALPLWTSVLLASGALLHFTGRGGGGGARSYLAVAGGIDVPVLLGSRSTYLTGGWGGLSGRPLRAGDTLYAGPSGAVPESVAGRQWGRASRPAYVPQPVLRLVPGPHHELLGGLDRLFGEPLTVAGASNRIGYRLEGPTRPHSVALASFGVLPGALQIPPNGQPILLMADAQPTGGYPVAGIVAAADLPLAAQLLPGDTLSFRPVTVAEARAAWLEQHRALDAGPEDDPVRALLGWAGA